MHIIQNNPYRTIGLLVGATAAEQRRQLTRLQRFLEADQEPEDDFSFPTLGRLHRTLDKVTNAASELNLDNDKMNAALFWFYKGNPITDEPAFDAIKEADLDQVINIWTKLTSNGEVSQRNASAYSNLGTLYLSGILEGTNTNEALLEKGISLKLKFLESDFIKDFKALATDETFKTTKKELQLLFLNQVQAEIEKTGGITSNKLLDILTKHEFSAKEDFLKGFVLKPIEQIEKKIEESKTKRKENKANAVKIGEALHKQTSEILKQLKSILGASSVKYSSIADKVANEILQCSIDFFNHYQEKESDIDYFEPAWKLAKSTEAIAIGKLTKDRIIDSLNSLEEMKEKEILQAIQLLDSIKVAYEENKRNIQQQVKELETTDIEIILGRKTINRRAVEDNIKNSIDWQKVNELLVTVLSDNNLKKIKECDNNQYKNEFLELANWIKENSVKKSTISAIIDKYKKIPPKLPFKIISSVIKHTDKDNKPLPITNPLYKKHTRFLGLKINVECYEIRNVTFYTKYIGPDGHCSSNDKISPKGYTHSTTASININTKTIDLLGWGDNSSCTYSIGKHRIEVYVDDYLIYSKDFVVDLAPSEKLEIELKKAEDKLTEIKNTQYFKSELETLNSQMSQIKEWQFLRSQSDRERQINEQQQKINNLVKRADNEKASHSSKQQSIINEIKSKIQKAEY
jgi:hypothetical protein